LVGITGSQWFPGGLGTFTAPSNTFLTFEQGPSQAVELQWASYYDAADQAGISRLYGGIHVSVDDLIGRITGSQVGMGVWAQAQKYFDGSITNSPQALTMRATGTSQCELRYNTLRGFYYQLQSSPDLSVAFTNEPGPFIWATNSSFLRTDGIAAGSKFFRVVRRTTP
jgi:hypothetical protein